tara:strand:+ start:124 stop:669 length:546 start_codon:yes stop_codon:yes gene_type:complete
MATTKDGFSLDVNHLNKQIKAIEAIFQELPKEVKKDAVWAKFWKKQTKPLAEAAAKNAPIAEKDYKYPRGGGIVKKGTLKNSIEFFRTRASKEQFGGYVGPRVKGKFSKEKGGWYGAFVEYGSEVKHYGKFYGKDNAFMKKAWNEKSLTVMDGATQGAIKIFEAAVKKHKKRLDKYGKLGY